MLHTTFMVNRNRVSCLLKGSVHVSEAMASHVRRFTTLTFDIVDSLLQNILIDVGFELLLTLIRKARRAGVVLLAPVCSSFCWLNRHTSERSPIEPLGNEGVPSVRDGNVMVSRVCLILRWIMSKGSVFIVEQPLGSILPEHPRFVAFITQHVVYQVSFFRACQCNLAEGIGPGVATSPVQGRDPREPLDPGWEASVTLASHP
jgi:hypothetical protein